MLFEQTNDLTREYYDPELLATLNSDLMHQNLKQLSDVYTEIVKRYFEFQILKGT